MRSELKLVPHSALSGDSAIEVWYGGQFIAAVYGAVGPGVRVVSKHRLTATAETGVPSVVLVDVLDGSRG